MEFKGKHNGCCAHANCWRKAIEGVAVGKDTIYFCDRHYENALKLISDVRGFKK